MKKTFNLKKGIAGFLAMHVNPYPKWLIWLPFRWVDHVLRLEDSMDRGNFAICRVVSSADINQDKHVDIYTDFTHKLFNSWTSWSNQWSSDSVLKQKFYSYTARYDFATPETGHSEWSTILSEKSNSFRRYF